MEVAAWFDSSGSTGFQRSIPCSRRTVTTSLAPGLHFPLKFPTMSSDQGDLQPFTLTDGSTQRVHGAFTLTGKGQRRARAPSPDRTSRPQHLGRPSHSYRPRSPRTALLNRPDVQAEDGSPTMRTNPARQQEFRMNYACTNSRDGKTTGRQASNPQPQQDEMDHAQTPNTTKYAGTDSTATRHARARNVQDKGPGSTLAVQH